MKILLASATGLFADTFAHWLRSISPGIVVQRCTLDSPPPTGSKQKPRLVLVDVDDRPPADARRLIARFGDRFPQARLAALGAVRSARSLKGILDAGAEVYVPRNCSSTTARAVLRDLLKAGARVSAPRPATKISAKPAAPGGNARKEASPYGLTARELDVLELACVGLSNRQISSHLHISTGVVKLHLHHAYEKLGVEGRVQAIRIVENLNQIRNLQSDRVDSASALLVHMFAHMSHEQHAKGAMLFSKGEQGNALYYIQRGRVSLTDLGVELQAGELLGELGVFAPAHSRTSGARCEEDCDLFKLTAEQARQLFFESPRFAYYLTRLIADRLVEERAGRKAGTGNQG